MTDFSALTERALTVGFSAAEVIPTSDLVVVPEFRHFCEENLCGCYDLLPACPPRSGTVEEMEQRFRAFPNALILQTTVSPDAIDPKSAKHAHNGLTEELVAILPEYGIGEHLVMGAGPWKNWSCMSAYCVNAQLMADRAGMLCWANDGLYRFFSQILF